MFIVWCRFATWTGWELKSPDQKKAEKRKKENVKWSFEIQVEASNSLDSLSVSRAEILSDQESC